MGPTERASAEGVERQVTLLNMAQEFVLTGFADEISPDLQTQVQTLVKLGVKGLDLRSVDGINVLDLTPSDLSRVHDLCEENGIHVQSIGSPVNKVPYDVMNAATEMDRLRRAARAANLIHVKRIRIFTPEAPEDQHDAMASNVIAWMSEQRRIAEGEGVILLHENDAKFWGAYPANAKRLFEALGNGSFRAAFDFANTTLLGFDAMTDWFPWLLPYLDTIHIKDARKSEGKVVPAGQGDGNIADTLKYLIAEEWSGPLTLEPHLQSAGVYGGYSGEALFEVATSALREVVAQAGGQI